MAEDEQYQELDVGQEYHFVIMDRNTSEVHAWDNTGRAFVADSDEFEEADGDEPGEVWERKPALDHPSRASENVRSK